MNESVDTKRTVKAACAGASAKYLKHTEVLMINEIFIVSGQVFQNASCVGSMPRSNAAPTRGIQVLMFGGFSVCIQNRELVHRLGTLLYFYLIYGRQ